MPPETTCCCTFTAWKFTRVVQKVRSKTASTYYFYKIKPVTCVKTLRPALNCNSVRELLFVWTDAGLSWARTTSEQSRVRIALLTLSTATIVNVEAVIQLSVTAKCVICHSIRIIHRLDGPVGSGRRGVWLICVESVTACLYCNLRRSHSIVKLEVASIC